MLKIFENNEKDDDYVNFNYKFEKLKLKIWKNRIKNDILNKENDNILYK